MKDIAAKRRQQGTKNSRRRRLIIHRKDAKLEAFGDGGGGVAGLELAVDVADMADDGGDANIEF